MTKFVLWLMDRFRAERVSLAVKQAATWLLVSLFYFGVIAAAYVPLWKGTAGIGWDLIESYWADLAFLSRAFADGEFPLWNPFERAGYPAHADPQPGIFYPVHWVFAVIGVLTGEVSWWLIQLKELFHHALGCILLCAFLRTRGIVWPAALVGGMAFALNGPFMGLASNNFLMPVAWTPFIWMATDSFFRKPSARTAAWLSIAIYLPCSTGAPPGMFYAILAALTYGLFRSSVFTAKAIRRREYASVAFAAGWGLWAIVLTGATQAMIHLPARLLVAESGRSERTLSYAVDGFMGLVHSLLSIASPTSGVPYMYVGILVVLLSAMSICLAPHRDDGAPVVMVASAAFFFVLCLGSQTPVLGWLVRHFPGFGLFRACARYSLLYGIFLAAAAGYGANEVLYRTQPPWPWNAARFAWGTLGLAAAVYAAYWVATTYPESGATGAPAARAFWMLGVAAVCIFTLFAWPGRSRYLAALALLPIVLLDAPYFLHWNGFGFQPRPDNRGDYAKIRHLEDWQSARYFDEFLLEQRAGPRLGLREFRGYTSFDPMVSNRYMHIINVSRTRPQLLREYNVRYYLWAPHSTKGFGRHIRPTLPPPTAFAPKGLGIFESIHMAPRVAFYPAVKIVAAHGAADALLQVRDPTGQRRHAVIEEPDMPKSLQARLKAFSDEDAVRAAQPMVEGRVAEFEYEHVSTDIEAPVAGLVVLNEAYFKGWEAEMDGEPLTVFPVDGILRGVVVPQGRHRIDWYYRPPGWTAYRALAVLGWLGILLPLFFPVFAPVLTPVLRAGWRRTGISRPFVYLRRTT